MEEIIGSGRYKDRHLFLRNQSKSVSLHKAGIVLTGADGDNCVWGQNPHLEVLTSWMAW